MNNSQMGGKTLGVIGKGGLVGHFFGGLGSLERNSAQRFFSEIDKVLFHNYGYKSSTDFESSGSFQEICKAFEHLEGKGCSFSVEIVDGFSDFFVNSSVILDASSAYKPVSLFNHAKNLGLEGKADKKHLSWKKDFAVYQKSSGEKNRIILGRSQFKKRWEESLSLLESIDELSERFGKIGLRTYLETPFSYRMLMDRAEDIRKIVQEMGYRDLPTFVSVVNEPCTAANIIAGICPEMTGKIVAATGYDLQRLEDVLNKEYASVKKKQGLEDVYLRVALLGFHDTNVMVPVICPQEEENVEDFNKLIEVVDVEKAYKFLGEKCGQYFHVNPREKTSTQVDKNVFEIILNASKSIGDELSAYPRGRPLCNGYFQDIYGDKGLFLVGGHKFRNGRAEGVPIRKDDVAEREEFRVVRTMEGLNQALKIGDVRLTFSKRSTSLDLVSGFVSLKDVKNREDSGVFGFSLHRDSLELDAEPIIRGDYRVLGCFSLNNIEYLLAGSRAKVDIKNLLTGKLKRFSLASPNEKLEFNCLTVSDAPDTLNGYLVAVHSGYGIFRVPLSEFETKSSLKINPDERKFILYSAASSKRDVVSPIRIKIREGKINFAHGNNLFLRRDFDRLIEEEDFALPETTSALDLDSRGNVYVGTYHGKIFRNGELFYDSKDYSARIVSVSCGTFLGKEGIFFNSALRRSYSDIHFTDGSAEQIVLRRSPDSQFKLYDDRLFTADKLLSVLDLQGGEELSYDNDSWRGMAVCIMED